MTKAKLELQKHIKDGKVQIEIIVWNSCANEELHNLVVALGYELTTDITGRRSIFCSTPAEVDAARNPIIKFFDAKGDMK